MAAIVFHPDDPEGLALVAEAERIAQIVAEREAQQPWAIHADNCRLHCCR